MSKKELNIDFGMAPLINNIFNNAKSNIKYLDYVTSDIVTIGSREEPYKNIEVYIKNDWREDKEQILNIFNNDDLRKDILKKQNEFVSS